MFRTLTRLPRLSPAGRAPSIMGPSMLFWSALCFCSWCSLWLVGVGSAHMPGHTLSYRLDSNTIKASLSTPGLVSSIQGQGIPSQCLLSDPQLAMIETTTGASAVMPSSGGTSSLSWGEWLTGSPSTVQARIQEGLSACNLNQAQTTAGWVQFGVLAFVLLSIVGFFLWALVTGRLMLIR